MSTLTSREKAKLEKCFGMLSGYVLNFSDRSFAGFFQDSIGVDIDDRKYQSYGSSKAKRMRSFWDSEPNYLVGKLILDLLQYSKEFGPSQQAFGTPIDPVLHDECQKIGERLLADGPVENLDALKPNSDEKDFAFLSNLIRESINRNEPEAAVDRLHTFTVKYVRNLCEEAGIAFDKEKPLQSLFGEYVKYLRANKRIRSEMADRILRTSISILDAFNDVRNNQSFAHDNPILNRQESLLIFNNISNLIRFLQSMPHTNETLKPSRDTQWDDLIFPKDS